ncbi:hypothetical protein M409DRAFT_16151 [Zasmidium cellare ATCC 36951]|uniref:DUF1593-domain-containing protein n=1 Tax=Zasmidium cellare ATCC 36951 TaxID=1080233 RepID=A0A6A6D6N2_ZASCE|nr:uncharacterized protein M409DRAFT_16151 [Zasmidium cellare ATCC 36951]KAF2173882.1 hypothetical protein M409DRAFT_16151 [Zasmidium cellare ATCC 36951]
MKDQSTFRCCDDKTRVFIVSDISNEPDDAESLVRYLLYCNEFETRGLVACTSTWMKRAVHRGDMHKIIDAYEKIVDNLNKNVHPHNQYPSAESIRALVKTGPVLYGKEALEPDVPLSEGAKLLIERLDESDRPLWILCWGGTNFLAQALQHSARLRSKMRVYALSDQDDTGAWIRHRYPDIFYIASVHGWNQYGLAAWTGISGDKFYGFDQGGPSFEKMTKEWIKENIQIGSLGAAYPDYLFIPEGDTPKFLYLIQNGLGSAEHPEWGSWGGRYLPSNAGVVSNHYADAVDRVVGADGCTHVSNQAAVWRWRDAFQDSFAARIQWILSDDNSNTNHAPIIVVNGSSQGPEPIFIEAEADSEIDLDTTGTYDPDGDELTYHWFQYKDITATQWWVDAEVHDVAFVDQDPSKPGTKVKVKLPPPDKCAVDIFTRQPQAKGQILHLILEVKYKGSPPLTSYKRVVVQVTNPRLLGGQEKPAESIAEAHRG